MTISLNHYSSGVIIGKCKNMDIDLQDRRISLRVSDKLLHNISNIKGNNRSDRIKRVLEAYFAEKPVDNCDYSALIDAIFELKRSFTPVGSNLNQIAIFMNSGEVDLDNITNFDLLDELQLQFKDWIKVVKNIQYELNKK